MDECFKATSDRVHEASGMDTAGRIGENRTMPTLRKKGATRFLPLPADEAAPALCWPTGAQCLYDRPDRYFARTRANAAYGLPGWTRSCGKRFHRGCDIAPVRVVRLGRKTTLLYSDCERGVEYPCEESVVEPEDGVFAELDGEVAEINASPEGSVLGLYVVLRHHWPVSGRPFFTLYAHLKNVDVTAGTTVAGGTGLGAMGQTSSDADARNWMSVVPHLHFEAWSETGDSFDPAAFLRAGLLRFL